MYQRRNAQRDALLTADRHNYNIISEPVGGVHIWNGQFDQTAQGSSPYPEGWEWAINAGQSIALIATDRTAGLNCVQATVDAIGGTQPGTMYSQRYLPVSVLHDYTIYISFRCSGVATTVSYGLRCYDQTRAFTGVVNWNVVPGVGWIEYTTIAGPGGVAFPANSYYARVRVQFTDTTANAWTRVDCIAIQQ